MDPLSIISSVAGLVGVSLQILTVFTDNKTRYERAPLTVVTMQVTCASIKVSLQQIQEIILENPDSIVRLQTDGPTQGTFDLVLGTCSITFEALNERLQALIEDKVNGKSEMTRLAKLKNMMNEQEMKDLLQNIQGLVAALNLQVNILNLQSSTETHRLLQKRHSIAVLQKVEDDAISLISSREAGSVRAPTLASSIYHEIDGGEFDMGSELINTAAYRRAFEFWLRNSDQDLERLGDRGERTDSDSSEENIPQDIIQFIVAATKEYFEKNDKLEEKSRTMRRIASRIGLYSSSSRLENDPRYGFVRHIMQQLVIDRNESGESHISYGVQHLKLGEKLFEGCKRRLLQEVLHYSATSDKNGLENVVTAELDQLARQVLELVKLDEERAKFTSNAGAV